MQNTDSELSSRPVRGELRIGALTLAGPLVLAPMAGHTETCARRLARRLGADLVVTEMVSAAGIVRRCKRTLSMLASHPEEQPLGVQIFGASPDEMAEAARIAEGHGAALIDINLGCPARKVCRNGAGAALLLEPADVARIVSAVRQAVSCPVTVKTRLGWDARRLSVLEIGRIAETSGADAIALHPRTRAQGFRGAADWYWVERLRRERGIPVIGSGDIESPEQARAVLDRGLCDGVMIGRAARGNPWLFSRSRALLAGAPARPPSRSERLEGILLHQEWLQSHYGREDGFRRMRLALLHYVRGMPRAGRTRGQLLKLRSEQELPELLLGLFREGEEGAALSEQSAATVKP